MIEIPECNTLAKQLNDTIAGKTICSVKAAQSSHGFAFYNGDPESFPAMLLGKTIGTSTDYSGQLEIAAHDMCILLSEGIHIRYLGEGETLPKKHQLHIAFDDDTCIVCTVQMYGSMCVYPQGSYDNPYYVVAKEKPSPLSSDFDAQYFNGLIADSGGKLSAKAFLATKQRIPGLGNGCLQDILYNARIHPQSTLSKLEDSQLGALYDSVKNTLLAMRGQGGRDTEKDLFGNAGGYETKMSSKTRDFPCKSCGTHIVRRAYLGGNVYFCPECQPVIK